MTPYRDRLKAGHYTPKKPTTPKAETITDEPKTTSKTSTK